MSRWMRAMVAVAVVSALACGDQAKVTVATFNTALVPVGAPHTDERVTPIATALEELDADVVCLQEVWKTDHLYRSLDDSFDTVVRHPDDPGHVDGCFPGELDAFLPCIEENCDGLCAEDLLYCGNTMCGLVLSGGCISCATGTTTGCVDEIYASCDTGTGGEYIFASYDTALMTRLPVLEQGTLPLDSTAVRNAVTFARVESDAGELDVYCAHFASPITGVSYDGPHGTWQGEREFQIQQTLDYILETSGDTRRVVLLGDLNERIGGERLPPIEDADLRSAAEVGEPGCTVCTDNLLEPSGDDRRVDHVYLGEGLSAVSFERIFDEPFSIEAGDETVEVHLSDHYGLRAVLGG